MKNKHFNLTSGIVLILIPLVFSFTGCKDDYETYYEGYGLVSKSGDEKFTVKLDDGYLLYPREYYFNSRYCATRGCCAPTVCCCTR